MKELLQVNNLYKKYGGQHDYAIKDISIHGDKGEIIGLLGHNGAGKSTTIKSIVGMHPYEKGEIIICDFDLKTQAIEAKKNFGYVSDEFSLFEKMTGSEYINFMADIYGVDEKTRTKRVEQFEKIFQLGDALHKQISFYSHGMKQKISIMGALIHNPKVFILDEPTTGLDPNITNQLKKFFIKHSRKGNLVIFSSHNLDIVEELCDRAYIINHGVLLREIDLNKFRSQNRNLEKYFLAVTKKGK